MVQQARYEFITEVNKLEKSVEEKFATKGMKWYFIQPYTPHYGGLWEANVKQVKFHLKRIVGDEKLSYEQFNTMLVKIEGILNSRPLCPQKSEKNVLTPAHFLFQRSLLSPPINPKYIPKSSLEQKYEEIQKKAESFWDSWHKDVLHLWGRRSKWNVVHKNIKIGDLVLVKGLQTKMQRRPLGVVEQAKTNQDENSHSTHDD
uniref:CSON008322 protein n=1 Tax=Culicoides sonorensis TaxID=179676 RepID=A0A336M2L8_CULSO